MACPVICNRGGSIQTAHLGPSVRLQCLSQIMQGCDISFSGSIMQCDGNSNVFPYMNYAYLEDFVNYDDNGALNGDGSSSVDGAGGYAAAISAIEKLDGSAPIQTAGSNYLATQTFPPEGAVNKHFGYGFGWQLTLDLVVFDSTVLVL
ncbi:hypothetical protein HDV63DRAFT_398592 [Trichoderma sp. SZMC 28014]